MSSEEGLVRLEGCPFCGEIPETLRCGDGGRAEMIQCITKGCVNPHVSYYGEGVARRVWNTRAPRTAPSDGEVERGDIEDLFAVQQWFERTLPEDEFALQNLKGDHGRGHG